MRRTLPLLTALIAPAAAPASASDMDHGTAAGPAVPIYNASFATPHLDVLAGDTVTWHNDSCARTTSTPTTAASPPRGC